MTSPGRRIEHGLMLIDDPSDTATIWYVPASPAPERGPAGHPAVTLILAGPTRLLTLGSVLEADETAVAAGRHSGQDRHPGTPVFLRPCPLQQVSAQVSATASGGGRTRLGVSTTSNYPPYHAVFSLALDESTAAQAATALAGGTGHLFITYHVTLAVPGAQRIRVSLDGDIGTWFGGRQAPPVLLGSARTPAPAGQPPDQGKVDDPNPRS